MTQQNWSFTHTVQTTLMQGIRGFVQLLIKPLTIRISPDGSTSSESLIHSSQTGLPKSAPADLLVVIVAGLEHGHGWKRWRWTYILAFAAVLVMSGFLLPYMDQGVGGNGFAIFRGRI
jgi:hypothetical protein